MKKVLNTVATEVSRCFILISGLLAETQRYDTNNDYLISVSTRSTAILISQRLPKLIQLLHQTSQSFNLSKRSTNASSELETVDAFKQNTENASE